MVTVQGNGLNGAATAFVCLLSLETFRQLALESHFLSIVQPGRQLWS